MLYKLTLISFQGGCQLGFGIVVALRGTMPCENGTLLSPVVARVLFGGAILSKPPDANAFSVIA